MFWGVIALAMGLGARAQAVEWGVRAEPSAAFPVAAPQNRLFIPGGSLALKGGVAPLRFLDVFASLQLVGMPAGSGNPNSDPGLAWSLGVGVRVRQPRAATAPFHPWLDGELAYVRTGDLDRFGFSLAAGLAVAAGDSRRFWVGPFLRYFQIVSPDRDGFDSRDALMLLVGISVEYLPPARHSAAPSATSTAAAPAPPPASAPPPAKQPAPTNPAQGDD
jgi:hypothetical protein